MIGHEPRVEPGALQGLRKTYQMLEVEIGVGIGAGIAPPCGVDADRAHKRAQTQLSRCCHRCPVVWSCPSWIGCRDAPQYPLRQLRKAAIVGRPLNDG